ncbi:MAG: non-ribosomal peptide synthetase, partial [Pseudonocardia sp.]
NQIDPIVTYLAALSAGHPVILVPGDNPGNLASVVGAYDPDVVVSDGRIDERREGSRHELHPDLALLLSTSGSTGSPKLVRLSHDNVQSNAEAIASYLGIRQTDRAATTMPMHYCYGLSVINSHLASGAALILTDLSVVDACFWDLFKAERGTTFAGVPYTFDLLDRVGFEAMELPGLRYVTQAGGRLAPERVRRYAELGQRNGWDLLVMYGQTEATARMAYLPPDLATSAPSTIGVPIPGGAFRLEPLPERPLSATGVVETGELVYTGDNVMLGYANGPADLSLGRSVTELRTGDVARRTPHGLFEVIGRRNRFAKIFGLRIDLDETERVFAGEGVLTRCADGDNKLVVAVAASAKPVDSDLVEQVAREHFGLPHSAVQVLLVPEVPRLPTGKPDYRRIVAMAAELPAAVEPVGNLRALYGEVLNRADVTDDDTFVSLEGDSLSYVEMSIRLEQALGHLPANWHVTPIGELVPSSRRTRRGWRSVETNVLLRAAAIVLIVGSHVELFALMGGAHVLLAVAGFNFGRFQVTAAPRAERVKRVLGSVA